MKKRNKVLIITAIAFLVVAVAALLIGYAVSGVDIIAWFGSKWAMMVYIVVGMYLLTVLIIISADWIKKL